LTAAAPDPAAEVEKQIQAERVAAIGRIGVIPTLWLAAVPLWSRISAESAGFPVPDIPGFIEQALDAGWCKTRGRVNPYFWITDEARRDVIGDLSTLLKAGQLQRAVAEVAEAVIRAGSRDRASRGTPPEIPGGLRTWADLVAAAEPARIPALLVERAAKAVADYDSDLVQELDAACEALAPLVATSPGGARAGGALDRARRILALGTRRGQLERSLDHYLDRSELRDAVTRLLQPDNEHWALHLRGVGGVGKTMLIRYLASGRYADARQIAPIPLASVDFDRIAPDYPVRRPVQLLVELADDLQLHTAAAERADRALASFRARATSAHEAVSGLRESAVPPLQHREVALAVDDFAAAVNELGGALLIVDTCEELAKADMDSLAAPAIRAMLDIIERLHERAPRVRVLLAGRRPLPSRGYLAVQPVAGFTLAESRQYLAASVPGMLSPELADAIIRQCAAIDGAASPPGSLPEHTSPFDLALYAAWAAHDPELDVSQVEKGGDGYVERRIIQRLEDPLVNQVLPLLGSSESIGVGSLARALECDPAALRRGLTAQEQEWGDAFTQSGDRVTTSPALARRLRAYFSAPDRQPAVRELNERLVSVLLPELRSAPLAEVALDDLLTALRLAPPGQAAALWDSIADRAMEPPGHWGTIMEMTRRILGAWDEEPWPTTPALRATVTAAEIAATRRDSPLFDADALWSVVSRYAKDHPDPSMRSVLRSRASLASSRHYGEEHWSSDEEIFASAAGNPALLAAVVAAVDHMLEQGRRHDAARLSRQLQDRRLIDLAGPRVRAWAYVGAARLAADNEPGTALDMLRKAEEAAAQASEPEPAWPDWVPPDDLLARVRIEHGLTSLASRDDLGEWERYAAGHLDTTDGERLASLCLRSRLRHQVVDPDEIERWATADSYRPYQVPTCTAHDLVPPLFTSIAEAWLAAGYPERALTVLQSRYDVALGTRSDEATVRQADAQLLRLTRRQRLRSQRSLLSRLAAESGPLQLPAWRARAVVFREAPRPGPQQDGESWHAYWQCQRDDGKPLPLLPEEPGGSFTVAADIGADLQELRQLRAPELPAMTGHLQWRALAALVGVGLPAWVERDYGSAADGPRRSAEPYQYLRPELRQAALSLHTFSPETHVPRRALADMAFEEAELTALRLPDVGAELFQMSANWYRESDDHLGALLAITASHNARPGHIASAGRAAKEALAEVRRRAPEVSAALAGEGPPDSPWQYWAERVALLAGETANPEAGPASAGDLDPAGTNQDITAGRDAFVAGRDLIATVIDNTPDIIRSWERAEHVRTIRTFALMASASVLVLSAALTAAVAALLATSGVAVQAVAAAVAAGQFGLAVAAAWHGVKFLWFADNRAAGISPLATVAFDAAISRRTGRGGDAVSLGVGPRSWQGAPLRARLLSWYPVMRQPRPMRSITQYGYRGSLSGASISWDGPGPVAEDHWWDRGPGNAPGTIRVASEDADQAWERILVTSLGQAAAGRVAWTRVMESRAAYRPGGGRHASLAASPAWEQDLGAEYPAAAGRTRHVIGRAISTAGGPAMDLESRLLVARQIAEGSPQLAILQAEPADDARTLSPSDDLAEKLPLAAELIQDGTPAVLLLPVLPAVLARRVARTVIAHASSRHRDDPRPLLLRLRGLIAPHVAPEVLDDVILFMNSQRFD
jgi:hypothetical protein